VPLSSTVDQLQDKTEPVVVLAIGDSTTAHAEGNWLTSVSRWMGERYDRPTTIHPWSEGLNPPGYLEPVSLTGGPGAPLTVWAASASGQDVNYTLSKLDRMTPMPPGAVDWVILNHGHNSGPDQLLPQLTDLLSEVEMRWPQAAVTVVKQNPQTMRGRVAKHRENLDDLEWYATREGYQVLDVFSLFQGDGLLDEVGIHPTPAGYALWTRAAQDMIKRAEREG